MKKTVRILAALSLFASAAVVPSSADAFPFSGFRGLTIRGDRGGQIIDYAIRMKEMEQAGSRVRFAGRCDSACTIYLGLPRGQTCIMPGASFGFHLPYGSTARGNGVAARYLTRNYPGWVRSWIASNGGLTHQIKTMRYGYASHYLPACNGGRSNPGVSI